MSAAATLDHGTADEKPAASALAAEREALVDLFDRPDQREGVAALPGKRVPHWTDA